MQCSQAREERATEGIQVLLASSGSSYVPLPFVFPRSRWCACSRGVALMIETERSIGMISEVIKISMQIGEGPYPFVCCSSYEFNPLPSAS